MAKKKNRTCQIDVHPVPPSDVTNRPKPRRLKAQRTDGGFELLSGALDLGLVRGDKVSCSIGTDESRYIDGTIHLREGTLSYLAIGHLLCEYHRSETIDQVTEDWRSEKAISVGERGGTVRAFWPKHVPFEDARMAVDRSAAEYGLPSSVLPSHLRFALVNHMVNLQPFAA